MICVTNTISINPDEIVVSFVRASGPGGQNVNKVSSAVQLRFNAAQSPSLTDSIKRQLIKLAGRRATREGVIVIEAKRYRLQTRNRNDAVKRLISLIEKASVVDKPRRASKPSRAAKQARIGAKKKRSLVKKLRRTASLDD